MKQKKNDAVSDSSRNTEKRTNWIFKNKKKKWIKKIHRSWKDLLQETKSRSAAAENNSFSRELKVKSAPPWRKQLLNNKTFKEELARIKADRLEKEILHWLPLEMAQFITACKDTYKRNLLGHWSRWT